MVVIGASALLLPLLMLQYVPTQDGPAHLGTAALLLDLDRGTGSTVQALYQPAWKFSTNQIYQFALVTLGHWMPLPVAERILLMAMVLLVPFGVATAQRMLDMGDRPPWAAILALPAVTLPVFDLRLPQLLSRSAGGRRRRRGGVAGAAQFRCRGCGWPRDPALCRLSGAHPGRCLRLHGHCHHLRRALPEGLEWRVLATSGGPRPSSRWP